MNTLKFIINNLINSWLQKVSYLCDKSFCKPTQIQLFPTLRCCLKCRMCDAWRLESSKDKELSAEEWKGVLKQLRDWLGPCFVSITGGESFIREDILDIVKFASSIGIKIGITTNGLLLGAPLCDEILSSSLHSLTVGLDSTRPEVHDYIRSKQGVHQKAVWATDYLNKYRHKMVLRVCTVLMKPNLDDMLNLVDWVEERGIDSVIFLPFQERFGKEDSEFIRYKKREFWIQDVEKLDWVLDKLIQRKRDGAPIFNSVFHLKSMKRYYRDPTAKSQRKCLAGLANLTINPYGNVQLCRILNSMKNVGNILEQNIGEMWNSRVAKCVRARIQNCNIDCLIDCHRNRSLKEKINVLLSLLKNSALQ